MFMMPKAIKKQDPEKTGSTGDLIFFPFMDKSFRLYKAEVPLKN